MKSRVWMLVCGAVLLFGGMVSATNSGSMIVAEVESGQADSSMPPPSVVSPKMVSVKVQFYTMTRKSARKQNIDLPKQPGKAIVLADAESKKFQDRLAKADAKNVNTPIISTLNNQTASIAIKTEPGDENMVLVTPKVNEDNAVTTTVEIQFDSKVSSGKIEQAMKFGEPIAILPYTKGKTVYAAIVTITLIENQPKEDIQ